MGDDVSVDTKAHVAFAFGVGFEKGVASERVSKDVARFEKGQEPGAALNGGHGGNHELNPGPIGDCCVLFSTADVLSITSVIHRVALHLRPESGPVGRW